MIQRGSVLPKVTQLLSGPTGNSNGGLNIPKLKLLSPLPQVHSREDTQLMLHPAMILYKKTQKTKTHVLLISTLAGIH